MSKPAAKRLLDIIKRRRLKSKLTKFLPTVGKFGTIKRSATSGAESSSGGGLHPTSQAAGAALLTCLIQDKDIKTRDDQGRLLGKLGDGSFGVVCRGKFIIMSTNNQLDVKKNRFFFNENGLKSKID